MSIYTTVTQSKFQPTYLMIKQHSITGLLYFCKTTKSFKNMLRYKGSGTGWKIHLREHGKEHVVTLWYCLFYDQEELVKFARMCSKQWDIVKAVDSANKKIWANLMVENGIIGGNGNGGANKGKVYGPQSEEHRAKLSIVKLGKELPAQTEETKARRSKSLMGKNKGKKYGPQSEEQRLKTSKACAGITQEKIPCPYCPKVGGTNLMKRYHFNNCKSKPQQSTDNKRKWLAPVYIL